MLAAALAVLGLACAPAQGVQQCSGLVATWDGVPLDTTVTLPAGRGRDLPLVVESNGFGNSKYEYLDPASTAYTDNAYAWARDGYAVLTFTARGQWGSCGTAEARLASPGGCATGYLHLADTRYEVRDTQQLIGRLVDEGVADPKRIGVTGDSYGGGQSLALAALRDRVMEPDGKLVPWRSPKGVRLRLAAAAPVIPWSGLVPAIAPNGRATPTKPVGVFKVSIANAILAASQNATGAGQPLDQPFVPGRPMGYIAPAGIDPEADVLGWVARSDRGEPYDDAEAEAIVAALSRYHSAMGVPGPKPPPLFVAAGFTDDIFPVDETLRFARQVRRLHPRTPLSLLFGDFGHQRAGNQPLERKRLLAAIHAWFDHYVRDRGRAPRQGVVAYGQTCPKDKPPLGPFRARSFARLARHSVTARGKAAQTLSSTGGDATIGRAIDPVAGGGDGCATTPAADQSGVATYRLPVAKPFTLLGAPAVSARLVVAGARPIDAQVASRLWDVAPDGTQHLVARGSYRPSEAAAQHFTLHPNGWRFARGHVVKLELLGNDAPYSRPSNGSFTVTVSGLRLRLPASRR